MKKKMICSAFLSAVLAAAAFAQLDLQPAAIVRLTRSEPISVKQFRTEVEQTVRSSFFQQYRRQPTEAEVVTACRSLSAGDKRQVLDMMINERLALQAAARDGIAVTENQLNQQVQQLRSQLAQQVGRQITDGEFAEAVKTETGLELTAFREQLRKQMVTQQYLMSKKQALINSIKTPTSAEISSIYNLNKTQFVRPETVRFSMIQVPYGSDRTASRGIAERLASEIGSNPSRFDEAVQKSQSPNAGYQAGDAGYLPRNSQAQQLVGADFIATAFSLKQGEVSKLIEGNGGYQIIKVTETYEMKTLELDDIAQLGSSITVRQYIGNTLLQEAQQRVLAQASNELVAELRAGSPPPYQIMEANINITW
jgi:parvulin-like peptidyl-prolyl isomerase